MKRVPVKIAKQISKEYGCDQVIIITRTTGFGGYETCTTYGKNKEHCGVANQIGQFLKYKVMNWKEEQK